MRRTPDKRAELPKDRGSDRLPELAASIGGRLREARRARGLSQGSLARLANSTRELISQVENGRCLLSAAKLRGAAEHLQVSIDYLFGLTDDPTPAANLTMQLNAAAGGAHGRGAAPDTMDADTTATKMPAPPMPARIRKLSTGWTAGEQAWLHAFIEAIRSDYDDVVRRAVLFGSKARGESRPASDIDVLVIVRDQSRGRVEEIEALSERLPGAGDSLPAVLAHTESEWRDLGECRTGFHHAVERDGISIL